MAAVDWRIRKHALRLRQCRRTLPTQEFIRYSGVFWFLSVYRKTYANSNSRSTQTFHPFKLMMNGSRCHLKSPFKSALLSLCLCDKYYTQYVCMSHTKKNNLGINMVVCDCFMYEAVEAHSIIKQL